MWRLWRLQRLTSWRCKAAGMRTEPGRPADPTRLFAQLRHCVWILVALQIWPLYQNKSGRVRFRRRSFPFAYAILAWSASTFIACRGLLHWIQAVVEAEYFSLKAYWAFFIIVGHISLFIPLLYWHRLRQVADAFNYTHRFQANWRRVFGEPLRLGVSGRAAVVGVLAPVVGVAFTTWSHDAGFVPWDQFPTYEVAATYLTIVPQTWQTLTLALENAALQLQAKLRSVCGALATPAGSPGLRCGVGDEVLDVDVADAAGRLRAIRELRWLWLQLAHATRLWGAACSLALAHLLLFCMAAVLLSVFGIAVPLLRGQPLDDRQAGMVVAILHNGHNIASVCGTGNRLRRQVKDVFTKDILRAKFPATQKAVHEEFAKFLKIISLQDMISLEGYVTLDRCLAVGCSSLLLTYVVVLMQFAYAKGAR